MPEGVSPTDLQSLLMALGLSGLMQPPKYTGGPSDQENVMDFTSGGIASGNLAQKNTGYGLGAPMPPGAYQGMLRP